MFNSNGNSNNKYVRPASQNFVRCVFSPSGHGARVTQRISPITFPNFPSSLTARQVTGAWSVSRLERWMQTLELGTTEWDTVPLHLRRSHWTSGLWHNGDWLWTAISRVQYCLRMGLSITAYVPKYWGSLRRRTSCTFGVPPQANKLHIHGSGTFDSISLFISDASKMRRSR